jgi:tRNA-2-methylthio-N6-dimethylallyladenosine synthase
VKAARLAVLQALLDSQRQAFNRATVGRRLGVVFDRRGRHQGQFIGRTAYMQSVHADVNPSRLGALTEVEILGVKPNSLAGRVVAHPS